jgi:solute carrier family 25 citrate transporter 1
MASKDPKAKKKNPLEHLIAGGTAGFVESSICHPLDTIKTRMQLRSQSQTLEAVRARSSLVEPALRLKHSLREPALRLKHSLQEPFLRHTSLAEPGVLSQTTLHEPGLRVAAAATTVRPPPSMVLKNNVVAPLGPFGTAKRIIQREGFMSLYKGLTAVWTGIIPKMAIRFVSFEQYRDVLGGFFGASSYVTFVAGLASGLTEAILVVTPAEVCKIRMQSQFNSLIDPTQKQHRKYTNVAQTAFVIVKEEGLSALYKGVVPTMLRQGCNQAVNFTAYQYIKARVMDYQGTEALLPWQSLLIGGFSGGMGPLVNNPLDVVKTRMQKQVVHPGKQPKYTGLLQACTLIAKEEGPLALWKGITPRLMRIMPGQAITFMTYEFVSSRMHKLGFFN